MTDEAAFLALCERFGLEAKPIEPGLGPGYLLEAPGRAYAIGVKGRETKQVGYSGFLSTWHFSPDGRFIAVGHWE